MRRMQILGNYADPHRHILSDAMDHAADHAAGQCTRAQGAQFVEHRAVMREVVSSTPARPTLRVFK